MASFVFDGAERLITMTGDYTLDVKQLYSRWKDWVKATDEGKNAIAFLSVGGDPIDPGAGTEVPAYIYLDNGWRIRPQEADHTLSVVNGVLLRDGGGDPFVDTLGAYTVRVNYQQPVQAISIGLTSEIEAGITQAETLRIILAALAGKADGFPGAGVKHFRDPADTKNRITATTDADGNRTSVTLDPS